MDRWPAYGIISTVLLVGYGVVLCRHDPALGGFPACPFHWLTGWSCPGCGAQRAVHALLHGRVGEAFRLNAALVLSIPLLAVQWGHDRMIQGVKSLASRNAVVWSWAIALVAWGVVRNIMHW